MKCPFACPLDFVQRAVLSITDYQVEMRHYYSYRSVLSEYNLSLNKVKYRHSFLLDCLELAKVSQIDLHLSLLAH